MTDRLPPSLLRLHGSVTSRAPRKTPSWLIGVYGRGAASRRSLEQLARWTQCLHWLEKIDWEFHGLEVLPMIL